MEVDEGIAAPLVMELRSLPNLKEIRSASRQNQALVWLEFDSGVKIDNARRRVAGRLGGLEEKLPTLETSSITLETPIELGDQFLLLFLSPQVKNQSAKLANPSRIARRLQAIPHVRNVVVVGHWERQYQVVVSPGRLSAYGLHWGSVTAALEQAIVGVDAKSRRSRDEIMLRGVNEGRLGGTC